MEQGGEEVILAEERNVILKSKKSDGTLVLTNKRFLFVPATESDMPGFGQLSIGYYRISQYFSDVKDLKDLPIEGQGDFLSIRLRSITNVVARKGFLRPTLKVEWRADDLSTRDAEFLQKFVGKSKRINLTDWATAIGKITGGASFFAPKLPDYSSIGQDDVIAQTIIKVLSDLQEKGLYEIEHEIERDHYEIGQEIDSDELRSKCDSLVKGGILSVDETGEFYWIRSPIEDIVR